jgi:exonuclease III
VKHKTDNQHANVFNLCPIKPHDSNQLSVHLWNARSIGNKTTQTYDYVLEQDVDVFLLTETWRKSTDHPIIAEVTPVGYSFINVHRDDSQERGGGIGILYKSGLEFSLSPINFKPETFEYACVTGKLKDVCIITVYRPYPSAKNRFTVTKFLEEFETFLDEIILLNHFSR